MAKKGDSLSDIDCPQFVDFAAGLTEQEDDIFFEMAKQKNCTPVNADPRIGSRAVSTRFNQQQSKRLFDKNQRSSRVMSTEMYSKTPKPSAQTVKERLERSPCVNLERGPPYEIKEERHIRRRSQSENNVEETVKQVGIALPNQHKRSLSADDVRIRRKGLTYPTTPLCLKRPKRAKEIKSTEQLELEKIAQLQKELSDHLRYNAMSMRRSGLRKRVNLPCTELPEEAPGLFKLPEPPREEKFNCPTKTSVFNKLKRIEDVRSKIRNSKAAAQFLAPPTFQNDKSSNSSTTSYSSRTDTEKSIEVVPKRTFGAKNTDLHSGFKLSSNFQKMTIVKPVAFEKPKEGSSKAVNKPFLPDPLNIPSRSNMKENLPSRTNTDVGGHRKELLSKHFLVAPTLRKDIGSEKETRNLFNYSSNNSSTISCGSQTEAEKSKGAVPKRALGTRNAGFHSGIKFSDNFSRVTVVKPVGLENLKEGSSKAEDEPCLPNPKNVLSTRNMKENVPLRKNRC
ncbi:uncharacterized protein LOC129224586 [Uloborus diversus]|uniref:uncharacterized protein LOC129224586 n=1 Tax=Uloborus diversus TaxID=327109 RepID=UPI00240A61DD|nr:uncharacterized protein LOC129224586 [Uloborus diversus]XP_054715045.1 uncharacterized protein LOC129224586 [Uloborus diversus]